MMGSFTVRCGTGTTTVLISWTPVGNICARRTRSCWTFMRHPRPFRPPYLLSRSVAFYISCLKGPALAFQSLGFYYGSQQPLHQDSAFVRVNSPLEFVASW